MKSTAKILGIIFFTSLCMPVLGYTFVENANTGEKSGPDTSGSSSTSSGDSNSGSTSVSNDNAYSTVNVENVEMALISAWSLYFKTYLGSILGSDSDHVVYVGQGQCGCKTAEYTYLEGSTKAVYPSIYCYEKEGEKDTKVLYETLSSSFESLGKQADDCFSDYRASLSYNFAGTCGCPTGLTASIGIDGQVTCTANDGITMLKRYDGMEVHTGFLDDGGTCDSANASCEFSDNCTTPKASLTLPSGSGHKLESISFCFGLVASSIASSTSDSKYTLSGDRTVKLSLNMDACRDAIYGKVTLPSEAIFLTADDIVINSDSCTIGGEQVTSSGKSCSFLKNLLANYQINTQVKSENPNDPNTETSDKSDSGDGNSEDSTEDTLGQDQAGGSGTKFNVERNNLQLPSKVSGASSSPASSGIKLKSTSVDRSISSPVSSGIKIKR